jgi:hypothetical protein
MFSIKYAFNNNLSYSLILDNRTLNVKDIIKEYFYFKKFEILVYFIEFQ